MGRLRRPVTVDGWRACELHQQRDEGLQTRRRAKPAQYEAREPLRGGRRRPSAEFMHSRQETLKH